MPNTKRTPARPRRPLAAFIYDQATTLPDGHQGRLRAAMEAHIERCIALLDSIDPDPDLEEAGDLEPSLGYQAPCTALDAELDTADNEPSLGSFDRMDDQRHAYERHGHEWAVEDAEDDGDDREPDEVDGDMIDSGMDQSELRTPVGDFATT